MTSITLSVGIAEPSRARPLHPHLPSWYLLTRAMPRCVCGCAMRTRLALGLPSRPADHHIFFLHGSWIECSFHDSNAFAFARYGLRGFFQAHHPLGLLLVMHVSLLLALRKS